MEDGELVTGLKADSEEALECIIRKYTPYAVAVIRNKLGSFYDAETAEELCSDVFFALWKNRHKIRENNLRGYIAAGARNRACSYIRGRGREEKPEADFYVDYTYEACEKQEDYREVKRAVESLDRETREIVVRFYYYEESVREIAKELKMNLQTVKSKLHRGRQKLKTELGKGRNML